MIEGMIRRAGLEPKYPVKINAIQEGMQNARNNGNRGGWQGGPPPGNPNNPPDAGGSPASGDPKAAAVAPPLVPGFGVEQKTQVVPGFDGGAKTAVAVATTAPATAGPPHTEENPPPPNNAEQVDNSIRKFSQNLLKQNDKDGNGVLEKNKGEWAELRDAEAIDTDHNGVITLDELTVYYQAKNGVRKRGPDKRTAAAPSPAASPNTPNSPAIRGKPYRILSPTERLPEGLPDWFARKDADADGQVSMAEYSSSWTPDKAKEFAHYDLNGDGFITPQECLQVDKKK
jgi:hypothetical protein